MQRNPIALTSHASPWSAADAVIDERLVGRWICEEKGEPELSVQVAPFDEREYVIDIHIEDTDPRSSELFRAFSASLDGVGFVNLQDLGQADSLFYIADYEFAATNELTVRSVEIGMKPKPTTPEALASMFRERAAAGILFEEDVLRCSRPPRKG